MFLKEKKSVTKTDLDPPNVKNVTLFFFKASLTMMLLYDVFIF